MPDLKYFDAAGSGSVTDQVIAVYDQFSYAVQCQSAYERMLRKVVGLDANTLRKLDCSARFVCSDMVDNPRKVEQRRTVHLTVSSCAIPGEQRRHIGVVGEFIPVSRVYGLLQIL